MRKIIITWVLLSVMLMPAHSGCALTWSELYLQLVARMSGLSNPVVLPSTTEGVDQNVEALIATIPQSTTEACDKDDEVDRAVYGILLFLVPSLMHAYYK